MSADDPSRALDPARVCSLAAEAFGERLEWIRAEILPHVLLAARTERGLAVELRASPEIDARLEEWIALERSCCAGIDFVRSGEVGPGRTRLEIRGVDPEAAVFRHLLRPGG